MKARTRVHLFLLILLATDLQLNADVVTDWNTAALNAIRARNTPPPAASRNLAILHTSIYDAVNGILRTHTPLLCERTGSRQRFTRGCCGSGGPPRLA